MFFQKKAKNNTKRKSMAAAGTPAKKPRMISDEKSPVAIIIDTPTQVIAS